MEEKDEKVEFVDRRRIKSAEDTWDDAEEADLERLPKAIDQMKDEMRHSDEKLKEYIAAYKERVAELDKTRKRLEDESTSRAEAKFADVVSELFPAMDDLDRAMDSARNFSRDDPFFKGVEMVRDRLFSVLSKHGMEMIDCKGDEFDPNLAQAVAVEMVEEDELDNKVVEQLSPGYKMGGRVLRHAMVKVGQKKE